MPMTARNTDTEGELTLRALWYQTTEVLGARNEARWICEVATSLDGDDFDAALDDALTERMVRHHDDMLARYRGGEPLQYVLGRWGFRRLDLAVDRRVLIPRPETELLVDAVLDVLSGRDSRRIVDLGTGSGAVGLALADELPLEATEVWITDVSEDAIALARANLAGIGRAARNVRVATGDWFEALPPETMFDVVVSNPPYVASDDPHLLEGDVRFEPHTALAAGTDGLDDIRLLAEQAARVLKPAGRLILEHAPGQTEAIRDILETHGFTETYVGRDLAGRERV